MKHTKNGIKRMLALCLLSAMLWPLCGQTQSSSAEVMRLIEKANDYWQANNSPKKWAFWDHAAYYTGNMEVYKLTGRRLITTIATNGVNITVGVVPIAMTNATGDIRPTEKVRTSSFSAIGRFVSKLISICIT